MKKLLIITLLLVLGGTLTAYGLLKKGGEKSDTPENSNSKDQEEMLNTSLKDLLTLGKNYKCTFEDTQDGTTTSGEIYIAGKKFRSNLVVKQDGKVMEMHSLSDNTWMYTWGDMMETGMKMNIEEMEKLGEDVSGENVPGKTVTAKDTAGYTEQNDFRCKPWVVDNSKFKLPNDVEFVDLTETLNNLQEGTQEMMQESCKMCDLAPDEASKQECRTGLGC
jgi:hypothetical protein